jgi:hypothetical protein
VLESKLEVLTLATMSTPGGDCNAYRCDHDASVKVALPADLSSVQTIQDLSRVGSESGEDFRAGASHAHEADARFGVCLGLALEDEVGGIGLRIPA